MKKTQIFTNKPAYLGLSILEISKIIMHNQVKTKYGEKVKLFCMETELAYRHSFIFYMGKENIYAIIAKGVETSLIFQIMNQAGHYLKEKLKK